MESSASGILMTRAYQGMKTLGIDADEVLRRCNVGIAPGAAEYVAPENQRERLRRFWPAVEVVSGDPDIGLHLGEVIPVLSGQIIEYLFMSSPNFGEGLKRSAKYTRLLSDLIGIHAKLDENPCRIVNSLQGLEDPDFAHQHVAMLLTGLRFYQQITGGAFKPSRASLRCKTPFNVADYERAFGCPLAFDAAESALYFEPALLQLASVHAEPNLLLMHERMADQQIQHLDKLNLLVEVRRIIGETLETGSVSLEFVAGRLGIKSSRLRANLASLDTSFNQVLSAYRFSLARKLLTETEESIDQIVYLTGFSEPSTFYRAFKRWTGSTPIVYRDSHKA